MAYRLLQILSMVLALFSTNVHASENASLDPQTILAVSKVTGACGILDEMLDFQKKLKMDGGNEFVARFWQTEAARQGKTVKELSDSCDIAILTYEKMWKAMEK